MKVEHFSCSQDCIIRHSLPLKYISFDSDLCCCLFSKTNKLTKELGGTQTGLLWGPPLHHNCRFPAQAVVWSAAFFSCWKRLLLHKTDSELTDPVMKRMCVSSIWQEAKLPHHQAWQSPHLDTELIARITGTSATPSTLFSC